MFDRFITYRAGLMPHAPAVRMADRIVSYATFAHDIARAATMLRSLEVPPNEPVAIDLSHDYLNWVIIMALARLGIASTPAADLSARWRIAGRAPTGATPEHLLLIDQDWLARAEQAEPLTRSHDADPDALGRVMRTSGTTGEAKRIAQTWRTMDMSARNAMLVHGTAQGNWLPLTGHATILGFATSIACWAQGQTVLLGVRVEQGVPALLALRPDYITMVPDQLRWLLDGLPVDFVPWPLRIATTGAALPPPLARRAGAMLTRDIMSQYASTEAGTMAVASLPRLVDRPGVAGHVLPDLSIDIVDEQGEPLPVGAMGRIRVNGARVARGYMDDPLVTEGIFTAHGFLTNDLGRFEPDGLLIVEGRCDDLMNIAGQKILPGWVEDAARTCPGVSDAAAFAVPDDNGLDACCLALVTTTGFSDAQLRAALSTALGWATILWVSVDTLPRNAMGKIMRSTLRDAVLAQRSASLPKT